MSVRTTPTGSGAPTTPVGQEPGVAATDPDRSAGVVPVPPADPGSVDPQRESRSELRAARRARRRLMVACAVVVAVCVLLTVLIVGLARDRSPGSSAAPPTLAGGAPAPLSTAVRLPTIHPSTPGALSS